MKLKKKNVHLFFSEIGEHNYCQYFCAAKFVLIFFDVLDNVKICKSNIKLIYKKKSKINVNNEIWI